MEEKITIAITDDDALIVSLLEDYLQYRDGLEVVFTAHSGPELLLKLNIATILPKIILLDLKMEGMDGVEVTQRLKADFPSVKVIIISSHYQKTFMGFMLKTGASAFLPKGISPFELVGIIQAVNKLGYFFKEDQLEVLREQIPAKVPRPMLQNDAAISEREVEVLKYICEQKTAKEIGDLLHITQRTAEGHKNNLFVKTGAKNIAGLVIYAIQHNYIKVEDLPVI
jgi:DNA-binding NarL/FixJ family response regulator